MEKALQKPMKLAFLTSCLEPERDGVGDYTRHLAEACADAGHTVKTFALRDPFAQPTDAESGRFTNTLDNAKERTAFIEQLNAYAPDWVSLQYVPYGYDPRGLPHKLPALLAACAGPWQWQCMYHEIWVGCKVGAPLKEKLLGKVQKWLTAKTMRTINPAVVHCHAMPYRELLRSIDLQAKPLPLFGSVPIEPPATFDLTKLSADVPPNWQACHLGGIFGTLHPEWPPEPLLTALREAAQREQRTILLLHFGGIGPGKALWESLLPHNDPHLKLIDLGRLSSPVASQLMQRLDFGVASSPRALIEKSSAAAAMLEYGLPLIVNRDEVRYPGVPANVPLPDPQLIAFNGTLPEDFFNLPKLPPASRLSTIAAQFLSDLGA